ncbi:polysaccharide lyase [Mycobacterium neglectum]|uniref:polysaccharide lyase n=1 Tax=Mycobacterium neglectum TaxID=242737 RepID=UPI00159BCB1A|nr:polysaccharide lyase [Mycobacterium neglectum]
MSTAPPPASPRLVTQASFIGDFETGNFDQWPNCQNVLVVTAACNDLPNSYSMAVETNTVRQGKFAARFEVRQGDRPATICCGDRAEVSTEQAGEAHEGDERWYQWSTMFGETFPASQGWSVVSQWHADVIGGSPPVSFSAGPTNVADGRWGLLLTTYDAPGRMGPVYVPWSAPVVGGVWNDIKMHVKWSAHADVGFIELWLNGVQQQFAAMPCAGQVRCQVRTLIPDGGGVYFKQGYYRDSAITATGVVHHDGFSIATTEDSLIPL